MIVERDVFRRGDGLPSSLGIPSIISAIDCNGTDLLVPGPITKFILSKIVAFHFLPRTTPSALQDQFLPRESIVLIEGNRVAVGNPDGADGVVWKVSSFINVIQGVPGGRFWILGCI